MTGPDPKVLVLQERDRRLLERLAEMRVVDREQASAVAGFHSVTRANTRLKRLTDAGYLRRLFIGTDARGMKALYTLTQKGLALVGAVSLGPQRSRNAVLVADTFIEHQLYLNSIFVTVCFRPTPLAGTRLKRWSTFGQPVSAAAAIIPDAYFEIETPHEIKPMFLEVDLGTEGGRTWQRKVQSYLQLAVSGEFARRFGQTRFQVLVVATSERRMASLRAFVAASTEKIFWFSTFEIINREGFWSPVWLRPAGDQKHSLL